MNRWVNYILTGRDVIATRRRRLVRDGARSRCRWLVRWCVFGGLLLPGATYASVDSASSTSQRNTFIEAFCG